MPNTNSASLTIQGYSLTQPYLKGLFDKIGLEFQVIHIGNYKGAGENLNKNSMSNEFKESYTTLFDNIYQQQIDLISKKRKIDQKKLVNLVSSGDSIMMNPNKAKELGFIDGFNNFEELVKDKLSIKNLVSIYNYSSFLQKKVSENKIAVVYVDGSISNEHNSDDSMMGDIVGAKSFCSDIEKIKNDKTVKAVVLRVNSPGGSALASELMLQSLLKLKSKKPLYVSMGPVAASGGYYISLSGTKIFASASTITGSIGVVSILPNYKNLSEKIGINFETLKKNKYDDIFNISRKTSDEEIIIMKRSMENIYKEFTGHVVSERKIPSEVIKNIAEGRVWTGSQALDLKLVDYVGDLSDTLKYVSKTHKIGEYNIESYPAHQGFFEKMFNQGQTKIELLSYGESKHLNDLIKLYNLIINNCNQPSTLLPYYSVP